MGVINTVMPRDRRSSWGQEGAPIQVLHPVTPGGHQALVLGGASVLSAAIPAGSVVLVQADAPCFIRLGDAATVAVANDLPIWPANPQVYHMKADTRIAGIAPAGPATLYITILD